ncbi:hypothetical protein [Maribacter luteus]|uniref:Uncharacterized protein n=1 Tax=Maribacter luteus TaxID=2594478 RepID=A0A6I2MJ49_9FLAO|nr:hypothetical protein [Maribacter luteus]MRX62590.1 hypothetical protein [Maribacter luteus]
MYKQLFFLFLILMVTPQISKAQKSDSPIWAKFNITRAITGNKDSSKELVRAGAYTAFYTKKNNDTLYMANVFSKRSSESYGPIDNIKIIRKSNGKEFKYEGVVFSFEWHYKNSYDDEQGVARVNVILVKDKPKGSAFAMKLLTEDNQFLEYEGEVEGVVNDRIFEYLEEKNHSAENL